MTRPAPSHARALIDQFLARFGAPAPITFELFGDDVLRRANALSFGREQLPTFDLPNARYVLSFGADFLGTWNSPVAQSVGYGDMRQGRPGIRGAFVQVESRMSQTGANADEWVPVTPGTEGVLALGLAHVIMRDKLRPAAGAAAPAALIDGLGGGPARATRRSEVETITGVPPRASSGWRASSPRRGRRWRSSAAPPLAHTNGLFTALAVNALNALVGSVGQPGGVFFTPQIDVAAAATAGAGPRPPRSRRLAAGVLVGRRSPAQVLLVDGANPVFTAPQAWRCARRSRRFRSSSASAASSTRRASLADLILPDHSFLESWSEAVPESGSMTAVASVAPPAMKPLHQTRATPDVLLEIGRAAAAAARAAVADVRRDARRDVRRAAGDDRRRRRVDRRAGEGRLVGRRCRPASRLEPAPAGRPPAAPAGVRRAAVRRRRRRSIRSTSCRIRRTQFLDGSLAHLPWLQEMPDPLTSAMWSSWVEINPATAARLGIAQGDVVEVASRARHAAAPAVIIAGHRARRRRDAGRPGTSNVHALRERPRRESGAICSRR